MKTDDEETGKKKTPDAKKDKGKDDKANKVRRCSYYRPISVTLQRMIGSQSLVGIVRVLYVSSR